SKTDWTAADKKFPMLPPVASPPIGGGTTPDNAELKAILDEIVALLKRRLYLPDGAPEAIALYIVLSHVHEAARFSPLLLLTAAVM
ncbi:hypothetical protein, partial [Proteus mirabilis]|uniref:hypothetical protein n=1 Tax=Proteus mirabilis TaxID=584 RepID=UPI0013D21E9E